VNLLTIKQPSILLPFHVLERILFEHGVAMAEWVVFSVPCLCGMPKAKQRQIKIDLHLHGSDKAFGVKLIEHGFSSMSIHQRPRV
jgi:hypothetical protein